MTDKIYYVLWSRENVVGCFPRLSSYSFKFLLEAAHHQYEHTKINSLYIDKHNQTRYFEDIKPNYWIFRLDFSNGKSTMLQWSSVGVIDMNKIKRDPNYHA
ncbi:hypothetical protein LCGC14_0885570 [marine sediment metagenome]|uniref:Uncharacterized protein n=1 Tax=marine sediment metagenome TaxID=412755 RepID=A0A0F9P0Q6_9ZZZZ